MAEYPLSVHGNEAEYAAVSPEDAVRMHAEVGAFNVELACSRTSLRRSSRRMAARRR